MSTSFEQSESFKQLKYNLRNKKLVLFLGAGINAGLLPQWDSLLNSLLDYAVKYRLGGKWTVNKNSEILEWLKGKGKRGTNNVSAYEKAGLIKLLLGDHYIDVLHEHLYHNFNQEVLYKKKGQNICFLHEVADLCQCKNVHAVVTYNYDDLLESCIEHRAASQTDKKNTVYRKAFRIHGRQQIAPVKGTLPVYHVHGFLPMHNPSMNNEDALVVLSYEEYYHNMLESFSWQTSIQLHFLRSFTCLYIGISLRDMNMLRLLSHAQHYSKEQSQYILMCRKDLIDDADREWEDQKLDIRATLFKDAGVELIFSGDKYKSLIPVLHSIREFLDSEDN